MAIIPLPFPPFFHVIRPTVCGLYFIYHVVCFLKMYVHLFIFVFSNFLFPHTFFSHFFFFLKSVFASADER